MAVAIRIEFLTGGETCLFDDVFILNLPASPQKPPKAGHDSKLDRKL